MGGEIDQLKLGVERDIHLTIPRGKHKDIKAVINLTEVIKAPVTQAQEYGELVISLDGEELLREPLLALESVAEGSLLKRLWDTMVLFFTSLLNI